MIEIDKLDVIRWKSKTAFQVLFHYAYGNLLQKIEKLKTRNIKRCFFYVNMFFNAANSLPSLFISFLYLSIQ